jgi:lysine/ornithine N-monooxygenase
VQEVQAKQTLQALKGLIANLTRLAESGAAMSLDECAALAELMKQKEELLQERDVQVGGTRSGADCVVHFFQACLTQGSN